MNPTMAEPSISVCIATYKRPDRLARVLSDLAEQTLRPVQIVVVDNDADTSARAVVTAFRQEIERSAQPLDVRYGVQPERNISLTRNETVAQSTGNWLAFIDDDERAEPDWLARLHALAVQTGADGVLGPVVPVLPADAPDWMRRRDFYGFERFPTGSAVPLRSLRFGNVLLRAEPVRQLPGPFDPAFKLSTGEDADMLIRLIARGATVVWHDEAPVTEPVSPARMSFDWLLQRAYSGGQEFARKTLAGSYGPVTTGTKIRLGVDALVKGGVALGLAALSIPFGRHHVAHWLIRAKANQGKLSAFRGRRYQEYAAS